MDIDHPAEVQADEIYWSVSRLSSIEECGNKYRLAYVERTPERKTAALAFGSAIHTTLEAWLRNDLAEGQVQRLFDQQWWEESKDVDWTQELPKRKAYQNKAEKILDNFKKGPQFPTVHLEQQYQGQYDGQPLRGVIDRIVDLGGVLGVIDYKTSKNAPDPLVLNRDFQLTSYWAGAQILLEKEINYFGIYHLLSGEIHWTYRCQDDWAELKAAIDQANQKVEMKMFQKNVGYQCKWCAFKDTCLGK